VAMPAAGVAAWVWKTFSNVFSQEALAFAPRPRMIVPERTAWNHHDGGVNVRPALVDEPCFLAQLHERAGDDD
jgi:hypothetical protein